jgi:hypothetical protein
VLGRRSGSIIGDGLQVFWIIRAMEREEVVDCVLSLW